MTKSAAFRDTVRSYRDAHPQLLASCRQATRSPVSLMPCPLLASVSVLLAIMPVSQLTLLLLLFLVLDIGAVMLVGRDFCAYQRTKFLTIPSFAVSADAARD